MGGEFSFDCRINYFGTDQFLCLTPASFALYFQDLAISHSNSLGYTLKWLGDKKRGWAITDWHMKINRYPHYGETIRITTWSNSIRRMQAERSFRVVDCEGKEILLAVSRWIYMDLERRRPVKLEETMDEKYLCSLPPALPEERYQIPSIDEPQMFLERNFYATRRDTDTNGHVNNTKYLEWAIDDVPDEIYDTYKIVDIRAKYRKECYKGARVLSKCHLNQTKQGWEVVSSFCDFNQQDVVFAEVWALYSDIQ